MGVPTAILLVATGLGCTKSRGAETVESNPPCSIDAVPGNARCATYVVWENRDRKSGRRIPLHIVILPALGVNYSPDPLFILAGDPRRGTLAGGTLAGGGQTAADLIQAFARLGELRARREIVFQSAPMPVGVAEGIIATASPCTLETGCTNGDFPL